MLYLEGDINFVINRAPQSEWAYFAAEHGPSACGLAFRVKDAHKAYARALELNCGGRDPITLPNGEQRSFLLDGDRLEFRARCERAGFHRIGFGLCQGEVLPARTSGGGQ